MPIDPVCAYVGVVISLYSIVSSALGGFGDTKTVSMCVKRLVYTNDAGEVVKGVCSNFLSDLKPGADANITGPVGKEMLMPKDPNATIIMCWPCCSFCMHPSPTTSSTCIQLLLPRPSSTSLLVSCCRS